MNEVKRIKQKHNLDLYVDMVNQWQRETAEDDRKRKGPIRLKHCIATQQARPWRVCR